ncbi:MAG: GxxExxY protein [Phycisphaerae bacterium]
MDFETLSDRQEQIASQIVDCAYTVHSNLGPGLLESIYEVCFCHELEKKGLSYQKQVTVPIKYDGIIFHEAFRLDVLVENIIICELKAAENSIGLWQAQLLTYLKLTGKRLGFIINFNVPVVKNGIKRMIL